MFVVGQKVIVTSAPAVVNLNMNGMIGSVAGFDGDEKIAVVFDTYDEQRHTCKGLCDYGYGWYFRKNEITPISDNVDFSEFEVANEGDVCDFSGEKADYKVGNMKFAKQFASALVKCEECGEWHYIKDLHKDGERRICWDCVHKLGLHICGKCGEVIRPENTVLINKGMPDELRICKSCVDKGIDTEFFRCSDCGDIFTNDHISENDGTMKLCERCAPFWVPCMDCGTLVPRDDEHMFGGSYFCERHNPRNVAIHRYGFKPEPAFFGEGDLYMGVELEIDGGHDPNEAAKEIKKVNDCIYCKHDGSLGSSGIEIVTHPCTLGYHENEFKWDNVVEVAREYDYQSHQIGTCGLHIHVNRSFFGESDVADTGIAKVMLFFQEHWDNIVKFSRRRQTELNRWANRPCTMIYKDDNEDDAAFKARREKSHTGRYQAVNLQNSNTVEFRIFRGTLNTNTIIATLQFIDGLCRYAVNRNIEEIYDATWDDVVNSPEFDKPELTRYLKQRKLKN